MGTLKRFSGYVPRGMSCFPVTPAYHIQRRLLQLSCCEACEQVRAMKAIRILLQGIIDYAGLFPPAALGMERAVRNYASYRAENDAWLLGRFILPISALGTFEAVAVELPLEPTDRQPWRLSVLAGADVAADVASIKQFNDEYAGRAQIDAIELKAQHPDDIAAVMQVLPDRIAPFFELPLGQPPGELVQAIMAVGARAKVRTGGTTPDAFPSPPELLRFIEACVSRNIPFKATAGLHHPLRAIHRLTYQPESSTAWMFGFLNVFLTAAFLHAGLPYADAAPLLEETSLDSLHFNDDGIRWRNHYLDLNAIATARERVALSFGSCSFTEPIDDLKAMHLL